MQHVVQGKTNGVAWFKAGIWKLRGMRKGLETG
jgi:hypothetical protein